MGSDLSTAIKRGDIERVEKAIQESPVSYFKEDILLKAVASKNIRIINKILEHTDKSHVTYKVLQETIAIKNCYITKAILTKYNGVPIYGDLFGEDLCYLLQHADDETFKMTVLNLRKPDYKCLNAVIKSRNLSRVKRICNMVIESVQICNLKYALEHSTREIQEFIFSDLSYIHDTSIIVNQCLQAGHEGILKLTDVQPSVKALKCYYDIHGEIPLMLLYRTTLLAFGDAYTECIHTVLCRVSKPEWVPKLLATAAQQHEEIPYDVHQHHSYLSKCMELFGTYVS